MNVGSNILISQQLITIGFLKECSIRWSPISVKTLKLDPLRQCFDKVSKTISQTLQGVDHMALTIDGRSVLDRLDINDKVYQIVTDNASAMIKAYKFGLTVNDDANEDDTKSFPDVRDLSDDNNDVYIRDNPSDVRLACFAHTMQLCIRDGLKNATYIPKVLGNCKVIAKFAHKSSKIADLLEPLNKNIYKYNLTRWNSEYMLIKSIVSITSSMENPIKFSSNDFAVLEDLIDVLDPFCDISMKCQADHVVTTSLVAPSITRLVGHLRDIKEHVKFCLKLVQHLQESIKTRFSGMINKLHLVDVVDNGQFGGPRYFVAAVLDPSFRFY
ncbi:unnamed protein product [Adineta ricciae]|uniref:Uncharacterized protein n=1 Tax=Adineta ricciae TaxID=249248 RepID=A0A815NEG2_ADIRI|nr:unnamed protein product [Adineta ricciae]CAF1438376.1 unnamed protein product [Adineta ricciae]